MIIRKTTSKKDNISSTSDLVRRAEKPVKLAFETVLFERRRSEFGRFQPTERQFFERGVRQLAD